MAFVSNDEIYSMSFSQYRDFLNENNVVTGTPDAQMIARVGNRLVDAAKKLLAAEGYPNYFADYRWEFNLVQDNTINAWCMPGGKIVFYTGILSITQTEAGVAVVMGHEIAHAILNHGQQRMSGNILQQIGAIGVSILTSNQSAEDQALIMAAFGAGTTIAGTLPFSRKHESEADHYGLILMAIAGYNPDEGVPFWQRMSLAGTGETMEILSTHPSDTTRIRDLTRLTPVAKKKAAEFGVYF